MAVDAEKYPIIKNDSWKQQKSDVQNDAENSLKVSASSEQAVSRFETKKLRKLLTHFIRQYVLDNLTITWIIEDAKERERQCATYLMNFIYEYRNEVRNPGIGTSDAKTAINKNLWRDMIAYIWKRCTTLKEYIV